MLLSYNSSLPEKGIWSKEQTILALYLYYQLPFGRMHAKNPLIIKWAEIIKRNSNAIAMKLVNFASLDPIIIASGRKGMGNTSSLDREIWELYNNKLSLLNTEAENILKKIVGTDENSLDNLFSQLEPAEVHQSFYGEEYQVTVSQPIRHIFFRSTILNNFDGQCCISGLAEPQLLIASHIVSWKEAPDKRLSPHNGLCLSALYDRAFDQHLLTLNDKLEVMISPKLLKSSKTTKFKMGFFEIEGQPITPPIRFSIDMVLLERHRQKFMKLIY